jgi:hypothetical protein
MLSASRSRVAVDTPPFTNGNTAETSNVEATFAAETGGDDPERRVTAAGPASVSMYAPARDGEAPRATGHRTVSIAAVKT